MKNDTSRPRPRARHPVAAKPTVSTVPTVPTRPSARVPSPRGTPLQGMPSQGTPSHGTPSSVVAPRTRLIRFRLNPRSEGDQQILRWLAQVAPYYRADAIRTALLTHILRRHNGHELASVVPRATEALPAVAPTTAQKLETMFSA